MGRPFIVLGDSTDHGGQVIEASGMSFVHGKRIARVGDKVTCPKQGHGHTTVIVSGDPTMIVDGQPVARHGDKCACGATLIASQGVAGAGSAAAPAAPQRPNIEAEVAKGLAVQQAVQARSATQDHENIVLEQWFSLEDEQGHPVPGFRYDLFENDRQVVRDKEFTTHTQKFSGNSTAMLTFWLNKVDVFGS